MSAAEPKAIFLSYASPAFALALPSSSDFDETSPRGKQDAEGTR